MSCKVYPNLKKKLIEEIYCISLTKMCQIHKCYPDLAYLHLYLYEFLYSK